jgi:hypothetical protein
MALSGVHITFGYSNSGGSELPYGATASETMAAATTSTVVAPSAPGPALHLDRNTTYLPLLSISASAAIFYATGPNPDASASPRRYMDPTFGREDIFVNPGDKFAWVAA